MLVNESLKIKLINFLASGLYSGHFPKAPGTFGTLASVFVLSLLCYLFPSLTNTFNFLVFCIIFTIFSIWISNLALKLNLYGKDKKDPKQIVIDEYAGYFVTLIGFMPNITNLVLGFLLFRIFDILKPPPVKHLESLKDGIGIVLDDVMAGILANLSMRLIFYLF